MTIKLRVKDFFGALRGRLLKPHAIELERQQIQLTALAKTQFRARAKFKTLEEQAIHVVFVCHMPALWSMFESIYSYLKSEPRFRVTVVALPYRHSTLPDGKFKDEGIETYLRSRGVMALTGYDCQSGCWLDPLSLDPDYLFFQTPYQLFDEQWSAERVSMACRICYIPYATDIFRGGIDETIHPDGFFKYVYFFFKEGVLNRELFISRYPQLPKWLDRDRIRITGQPKLDFISSPRTFSDAIWKGGEATRGRRVLWTPRWNTSDGVCHFFDYNEFLSNYFSARRDASFVFRPHPLCLQNFIKTGEMSEVEVATLVSSYKSSPNMVLDQGGGYHDTFMTSDLLVTDLSSMLLEYFATGKPVVYTHRHNRFNALGERLAEGCYWARNQNELESTLDMLLSGKDPLKDRRKEIIEQAFHFPEGGACAEIGRILIEDYEDAAFAVARTGIIYEG